MTGQLDCSIESSKSVKGDVLSRPSSSFDIRSRFWVRSCCECCIAGEQCSIRTLVSKSGLPRPAASTCLTIIEVCLRYCQRCHVSYRLSNCAVLAGFICSLVASSLFKTKILINAAQVSSWCSVEVMKICSLFIGPDAKSGLQTPVSRSLLVHLQH